MLEFSLVVRITVRQAVSLGRVLIAILLLSV